MNYSESIKFNGNRNLSIILLSRKLNLPVCDVLKIARSDMVMDHDTVLFRNSVTLEVPAFLKEYLNIATELFPASSLVFLTDIGSAYRSCKFVAQFKKLLTIAGIEKVTNDPRNISDADFSKLLCLEFHFNRPQYQKILAVMFSSYLGLRPSEIAKLKPADFDFESLHVMLRETKAQKNQKLRILKFMKDPLMRYVSHLGQKDPLFVKPVSNHQWKRQDVTVAILIWCKEHGFESHVNGRIMRSSMATQAARFTSILTAKKILRHRHLDTTDHYVDEELDEAGDDLETMHKNRSTVDEGFGEAE